jgi:DNA-binding CsgD family transcriptional regulator
MSRENRSTQMLVELRRLARQRKPLKIPEFLSLMTRVMAGCSPPVIEERPNGIVIRFAGVGASGMALTCHLHRPADGVLTTAESAVVRELREGRTLAQIAHLRGVSPNTVKSQVRNIFRKLNVESRVGLLRLLGP